ncbi:MAG TPA: hypothetical protein VF265_01635 [Nevskiaceae bacterium]
MPASRSGWYALSRFAWLATLALIAVFVVVTVAAGISGHIPHWFIALATVF